VLAAPLTPKIECSLPSKSRGFAKWLRQSAPYLRSLKMKALHESRRIMQFECPNLSEIFRDRGQIRRRNAPSRALTVAAERQEGAAEAAECWLRWVAVCLLASKNLLERRSLPMK
jgi:hypothetical protein